MLKILDLGSRGTVLSNEISITAQLICIFVFAYAKSRFSHDTAHTATEPIQKTIGKPGIEQVTPGLQPLLLSLWTLTANALVICSHMLQSQLRNSGDIYFSLAIWIVLSATCNHLGTIIYSLVIRQSMSLHEHLKALKEYQKKFLALIYTVRFRIL